MLQVHYAAVDKIPDSGDRSGVVLTYTDRPQRKRAGVYFIGTNGMIAPKTTTYMEAACKLNTKLTIHPFAFRTHTHALGRVVSGWKVSEDMEWSLIGKEDPQKPQMFYPVSDSSMTVTGGDTLAARCTMVSYRDRITWVGATAEDEMCNFYMMYWVEGEEKLGNERCNSVGPPVYTWDRWLVGGGLSSAPLVSTLKAGWAGSFSSCGSHSLSRSSVSVSNGFSLHFKSTSSCFSSVSILFDSENNSLSDFALELDFLLSLLHHFHCG